MATKFITVSIEIMHDKKLSQSKKFILAEIQQLVSLEKGCIATNSHFAKLIGITSQGVSKALNELAKDGYININNAQTKRNFGREISINSGKSGINSGLESKENITYIPANVNLQENYISDFSLLWKDYALTFLANKNRRGGSKKKALSKYSMLRKKEYSAEFIYTYCENHCGLEFGWKDLERLLVIDLVEQYKEDVLCHS